MMLTRALRPAMLATALSLAIAPGAGAHPHVFVDAKSGFVFDDQGRLTALRITWAYDTLTTLFMFDTLDLDKDRDGKLDDADRAAIVAGETTWPEDYNGDVYLDLRGQPVAMGRPQNGVAWLDGDQIAVVFDLPLAAPLADLEGVTLRLYDPFYYFAYDMVALTDTGATPCEAEIIQFTADAATEELQVKLGALSREETPEIENVGALFADRVELTCD